MSQIEMLNDPNDRQVAGDHYRAEYQHWDFVIQWAVPYLPAQVTKYLTRHKQKNGRQDLEKALHYAEKMMHLRTVGWKKFVWVRGWSIVVSAFARSHMTSMYEDFLKFSQVNNLDAVQGALFWASVSDMDPKALVIGLRSYMEAMYPRPVADDPMAAAHYQDGRDLKDVAHHIPAHLGTDPGPGYVKQGD